MGWPTLRLDEVAEVAAGNPAPQEPSDFADNGSLFIRMQDVGRWHHTSNLTDSTDRVSADAISKHRLRLFRAGSVLIPKSGASVNLNHRAMLGCDAYVVSHLAVIVPDRSKLLPEYLYLWSLSYDPRSQAQTTSLPSLPLSLIKAATMQVPPLPEQRHIVDLLSRAEGIVRLRREAEKKAAELIPALFLDMFGDPTTNPKGWDIKPLHTVAEVGSGNGFPNAYQGKTEGAYPFYKVSDMNTKGNEVEMIVANNYISEDDLAALRAKTFPAGTVIFPKIGAAIATNKKRVLTRPSCFDNNVMGITPSDGLNPAFLHALMMSKDISDFASDSNPPSMRKTTVEAWEIPVPPLHMQVEFGKQVEAIRSIQSQQSAATAKARVTFDALLAQAFS